MLKNSVARVERKMTRMLIISNLQAAQKKIFENFSDLRSSDDMVYSLKRLKY